MLLRNNKEYKIAKMAIVKKCKICVSTQTLNKYFCCKECWNNVICLISLKQ